MRIWRALFFFRLAAGDVRTFGNMNATGRSEIRTLPPPPLDVPQLNPRGRFSGNRR